MNKNITNIYTLLHAGLKNKYSIYGSIINKNNIYISYDLHNINFNNNTIIITYSGIYYIYPTNFTKCIISINKDIVDIKSIYEHLLNKDDTISFIDCSGLTICKSA